MSCFITVTELETLTGKSYRFLKRLLQDLPVEQGTKNSNLYDCRKVIREFFKTPESKPKQTLVEVQFDRQKAEKRLAEAKARKIEFEVQVYEKKLFPAESVEANWSKLFENFKSKLSNVPPKLASKLSYLAERAEIERVAKEIVFEALSELSYEQGSLEQFVSELEAAGAPSDSDDE